MILFVSGWRLRWWTRCPLSPWYVARWKHTVGWRARPGSDQVLRQSRQEHKDRRCSSRFTITVSVTRSLVSTSIWLFASGPDLLHCYISRKKYKLKQKAENEKLHFSYCISGRISFCFVVTRRVGDVWRVILLPLSLHWIIQYIVAL